MVTDNLGLLVHRECQFSTLTANTDNERATEKKHIGLTVETLVQKHLIHGRASCLSFVCIFESVFYRFKRWAHVKICKHCLFGVVE